MLVYHKAETGRSDVKTLLLQDHFYRSYRDHSPEFSRVSNHDEELWWSLLSGKRTISTHLWELVVVEDRFAFSLG